MLFVLELYLENHINLYSYKNSVPSHPRYQSLTTISFLISIIL